MSLCPPAPTMDQTRASGPGHDTIDHRSAVAATAGLTSREGKRAVTAEGPGRELRSSCHVTCRDGPWVAHAPSGSVPVCTSYACHASQLDADENGFPEHIALVESAMCVFS